MEWTVGETKPAAIQRDRNHYWQWVLCVTRVIYIFFYFVPLFIFIAITLFSKLQSSCFLSHIKYKMCKAIRPCEFNIFFSLRAIPFQIFSEWWKRPLRALLCRRTSISSQIVKYFKRLYNPQRCDFYTTAFKQDLSCILGTNWTKNILIKYFVRKDTFSSVENSKLIYKIFYLNFSIVCNLINYNQECLWILRF